MRLSRRGLAFIARREGFRSCPYRDSGGIPTIGYGHTGIAMSHPCITEDEARTFLRHDTNEAQSAVRDLVKVPLKQRQFDVLTSFVFNVGAGNFASSTLLKVLNAGHYGEVPHQLKRWVRDAQGVVQPGLVKRRRAEARRWRIGF